MHIYWAFGGRWASEGVFPTFENQSNAGNDTYIDCSCWVIVFWFDGAYAYY